MASGVTLEQVTQVADMMLARGERPTAEAVRKALGTGAPVTVNRLLSQYFAELPARLTLPGPVAKIAAALVKAAQAAGHAQAQAAEAERQKELQEQAEQLERARAEMARERQDLGTRIAVLETELGQARADLDAASQRAGALQSDIDLARQAQGVAEEAARNAADERQRVSDQLRTELDAQRETHAKAEASIKQELAEAKHQVGRIAAASETERQNATGRIAKLEGQVEALTSELAERRKHAIASAADLTREQRARSAAETSVGVLQEQLTTAKEQARRQAADAAEQRNRLRDEVDVAKQDAQAARRERDEAAMVAATLRGRVEQLESQLRELSRNRRPTR